MLSAWRSHVRRGSEDQSGFALASAMIILMIVMMLGLALLRFGDDQQSAAARAQSHESAYALAESALNAQVSTLASTWTSATTWAPSAAPSNCTKTLGAFPTGCQCNSSSSFSGCPSPTGSWLTPYTPIGSAWCPPGTPTDAWGSGATASWGTVPNSWTTYVRDDGGGTGQLFSSGTDMTQPGYDLNGNGSVWIRAAALYNCRLAVVITKASEQITPLTFPQYAINANGFTVSNAGNKTVIDTAGTYAQPSNQNPQAGAISVRCGGLTAGQLCTQYRVGAQIDVDTCVQSPTSPNPCTKSPATATQTMSDLSGLKAEALVYGTYFAPGSANGCPTTTAQLSSVATPGGVAPVFVDVGCPSFSFNGGTINSAAAPGFLILTNQTFTLGGGANFYGMLYDANLCSSGATYSPCTTASTMVTVQGNAVLQGAINIDGAGMLVLGSSKLNFIYDARVFPKMQQFSGAAALPNSFRSLPVSQ